MRIEKWKKNHINGINLKRFTLENFIKHKPLISEECSIIVVLLNFPQPKYSFKHAFFIAFKLPLAWTNFSANITNTKTYVHYYCILLINSRHFIWLMFKPHLNFFCFVYTKSIFHTYSQNCDYHSFMLTEGCISSMKK